MLCHRLVYGLPSTEYIALEDGEGEIRRNEEEKRRGDEGEERRGEDRKREEDNTANSRCLLALFVRSSFFFSRLSVLSLSSRFHPARSSRHSLSRSPLCSFALPAEWRTRVALFGCDKRRINLNKWHRAACAHGGSLIAGCLVKVASPDCPY